VKQPRNLYCQTKINLIELVVYHPNLKAKTVCRVPPNLKAKSVCRVPLMCLSHLCLSHLCLCDMSYFITYHVWHIYVWHIWRVWIAGFMTCVNCRVHDKRLVGCLKSQFFFAKEPLVLGLFYWKRLMKIRHPMTLHHSVVPYVDASFAYVLQCVAVCCSVLQCVAVCCSVFAYVIYPHMRMSAMCGWVIRICDVSTRVK